MKRLSLLCYLAALVAGTPAWAQFSSGPETETKQALARINASGHLEVAEVIPRAAIECAPAVHTVTEYVQKEEARTFVEEKDGREITVEKTVIVAVPQQREETYTRRLCKLIPEQKQHFFPRNPKNGSFVRSLDGTALKVFEIDGKSVDAAQLPQRLKDWTLVLLTHNGQMAAGLYSGLYKPGTLVIAIPAPLKMATALPAPAPPPRQAGQEQSNLVRPAPATPAPVPVPQNVVNGGGQMVKFPENVPPSTVFSRVTGDSIVVRYHTDVTEFTFLMNKVTKTVDGKPVWEDARLPVEHTDRNSQVWKIPVSSVRGWSGDGKALSLEELRVKLKVEIPVLATVGNRNIDPFWFQNLKPESIVISTPLPDDAALAPSQPPVQPVPAPAPIQAPAAPGVPQAATPPRALSPPVEKSNEAAKFLSAAEREVLKLTNEQRAKHGLPPLIASEKLCQAARRHATRMGQLGTLDHTLDGVTFDQRIEATGYSFSAAGENLSNAHSAQTSMTGWMDSEGHRQNILSDQYREIGIGTATNANDRRYWVQVFATPVKGP